MIEDRITLNTATGQVCIGADSVGHLDMKGIAMGVKAPQPAPKDDTSTSSPAPPPKK